MRTTKRFTPTVLARFLKEGRGQGTGEDYIPWHRVSRSDPSSRGRSHLQMWNGRQAELLSDGEHVELFFATMLPSLVDALEQYPLSLDPSPHELASFYVTAPAGVFPGTKTLALQLGYRYPTISADGKTADWVPTTDLLLVLKTPESSLKLVAVSIKPSPDLTKSQRKSLSLEKAYWDARGVEWLLITPAQFNREVALTLRRSAPWALGDKTTEEDKTLATAIACRFIGRSLIHVLETICSHLDGDLDNAQRVFWQAVWRGMIPLDLRRGWRPHLPIVLLPTSMFWSLNPIASGRSAWN